MSSPDPVEARGALARIRQAVENEQRYYDALVDAGRSIVEVAERLQAGGMSSEDVSRELLDIARGILVAMRLNIPEDSDDQN